MIVCSVMFLCSHCHALLAHTLAITEGHASSASRLDDPLRLCEQQTGEHQPGCKHGEQIELKLITSPLPILGVELCTLAVAELLICIVWRQNSSSQYSLTS